MLTLNIWFAGLFYKYLKYIYAHVCECSVVLFLCGWEGKVVAQLGSPATASLFASWWYGVTEGLGG